MVHFLETHFQQIHIFEMVGLVILISLLECVIPRKPATDTLRMRWFGNFSLLILGLFITGLAIPMFGYGWASYCAEHGWGLLPQVTLPAWMKGLITFLALDLVLYARHWLDHHSSLLWRLHRVHHSDNDIDVTTTLRFHPLDMIFIVSLDAGVIALLGATPLDVVLSRLLSTIVAYGSHANVKLPVRFERFVQQFVTTPNLHRIHHSLRLDESMKNYGSTLPLWDRIFGTWLPEPLEMHGPMEFGVSELRERKHQSLPWMLAQPFLDVPAAVPMQVSAMTDSEDATSA